MRYYSTQRPITPGSYPKSPFNEVLQVVNFDARTYCEEIGSDAWGYIEYKYPLHPDDVAYYELSVKNMGHLHFPFSLLELTVQYQHLSPEILYRDK